MATDSTQTIFPSTHNKLRQRHRAALPEHLGGYQAVEQGRLQIDDLLVFTEGTKRKAEWVDENTVAAKASVKAHGYAGCDVYRKIAVPKPGALDNRTAPVSTAPARGATYDDGKPPLACLPLKGLREVALVQLYGKEKYGDFYNYKKGIEISRNASCAMRHIADFMDGKDLDSESGRSHLAHAACRLLFILENIADGTVIDDRFKLPVSS